MFPFASYQLNSPNHVFFFTFFLIAMFCYAIFFSTFLNNAMSHDVMYDQGTREGSSALWLV